MSLPVRRLTPLRGQFPVSELQSRKLDVIEEVSAVSPAADVESRAGPEALWLQQEDEDEHHRDTRNVKTRPDLKVVTKNSKAPAKDNFDGQSSDKINIKEVSDHDDHSISDIISSYTVHGSPTVKGLAGASGEKSELRCSNASCSTSSSKEEPKKSTWAMNRLTSPFDDSPPWKVDAESPRQVTRIPRKPAPLQLRSSPNTSVGTTAHHPFLLEEGSKPPEKPVSWFQSRRKPLTILAILIQFSIVLLTVSIVLWTQDKRKGRMGTAVVICGVLGLVGLFCALLSAYDVVAHERSRGHSKSRADNKRSNTKIGKEVQKPDKAKIRLLNGYKLDKNGVWKEVYKHGGCGAEVSDGDGVKATPASSEVIHLEAGLPTERPTSCAPLKGTSVKDKKQIKLLKSYIISDSGNWCELAAAPRYRPGKSIDGHNLQAYSANTRQRSKESDCGKILQSDHTSDQQTQEPFIHELESPHQIPEKPGSEVQWPLKNEVELPKSGETSAAFPMSLDWETGPEIWSENPELWAHLAEKRRVSHASDMHRVSECMTEASRSSEDGPTTSRIVSLYSTTISNEDLYHNVIRDLASTTSLMPSVVGNSNTACMSPKQEQQTETLQYPLTPHYSTSRLPPWEIARHGESNQRVRIWQKYLLGPGVELPMVSPPHFIMAEPQSQISRWRAINFAPGRLSKDDMPEGLDGESEQRWRAWSWARK
ncbi:MAG: hypothetical protein Q9191_003695 [Dirinaria sp. TL-2023a]